MLALLDLLVETADEASHACDCAALPALTAVADAAAAKLATGAPGAYAYAGCLLRLLARLSETLTRVPRDDVQQGRLLRVPAAGGAV